MRLFIMSLAGGLLFLSVASVPALDKFMGDSAIYTYNCSSRVVPANVLFVLDNSSAMNEPDSSSSDGGLHIDLVQDALLKFVEGGRDGIRFGIMEFGHDNLGGQLTFPVSDLSDDEKYLGFKNRLQDVVDYVKTTPGTTRPLAEALLDARFYFDVDRNAQTTPISGTDVADSPVEYRCQKNFIILIASGGSVGDGSTRLCQELPTADYDRDGHSGDRCSVGSYGLGTHLADDVARFAYDSDLSSALEGRQNLTTHAILVSQPENELLRAVAEDGKGLFRQGGNAEEVSGALLEILENIVAEVNTAFVAPVVPVSPENLTYSGSRVYMGFFRPISQRPWHGNLKKFGIAPDLRITDKNGIRALCPDPLDSPRACEEIPPGGFKAEAVSYWSSAEDAGEVELGGAGETLLSRDPAERRIYSNLSANPELTHGDNTFNGANVTPDMLGFSSSGDAVKLIDYLRGYDAYDQDGDTSISDSRAWIMGDVLHSSPKVIHYRRYPFTQAHEADPGINQSVIFVGGNDGMLHAFSDADGREMWAFIPDDLLPELKELAGTGHAYFVDGSPAAYVYDRDGDGNIGPRPEQASEDGDPPGMVDLGEDDKVVVVFGQRRGGRAYYALDVTDPDRPKFLWKLDNQTVDDQGIVLFPQLGESWSEPQLHLTQIGPTRKIVAFIGAGYDLDEDSRFGRSGRFPVPPEPAVGAGDVTSNTGMASPTEPPGPPGGMPRRASARGLGVYAFEVATINSNGIPIIPVSAAKVWGYTEVNDDGPKSGIPSDVTVLDSDHDGLADRLYVADLAGRLWRFTLGDGAERGWTGNVIFSPDVSSGRKVFYRPSVVQGPGYWMLGFGTGDRAHPLNTAVVDRFYMIKDLGQTTASGIDDSLLVDVTTNDLQLDDTDVTAREGILKELNASSKYGWYLDLDGLNQDGHHGGEKVLAAPLIYDGIAYFTTYMPDAPSIVSADPCAVGNPGTARLYAVDYRTGEAVLNFYIGNDDEPGTVVNKRAISPAGKVLRREDRGRSLGTGIPSGVVVMVPPSGDAEIIIGTDGGFSSVTPNAGGSVYQIYWKDW